MLSLIPFEQIQKALPTILASIPQDWRGTTFNNSSLLGREAFSQKLINLVQNKQPDQITAQDLSELGNAEDYLRVSSNVSCVLETVLALQQNRDISRVFTFASNSMAIVAVILNSKAPVHFYIGENGADPFDETFYKIINLFHNNFKVIKDQPKEDKEAVVITNLDNQYNNHAVDAVYRQHILYINNATKISPSEIMVIRKRTTTPVSTPFALQQLQLLAGLQVTEGLERASQSEIDGFYEHLQTMSGTHANKELTPVCCTAGLPTLSSIWLALALKGGADVLMASTAYGGSSQLTDVITGSVNKIRKHKFDITGQRKVAPAIKEALDEMAAKKDQLQPYTVLFMEIPTNPDMKVPNIQDVTKIIQEYKQKTQREVLVLVDTTFAPASQVLAKIHEADPELPAFVFISMSKSVSRGFTTAGTIISGETQKNKELFSVIHQVADSLDTKLKKEQLLVLSKTHHETEKRNLEAYQVASQAGQALQQQVKETCNYDMALHFPSEEVAKIGFTSSTFSFNLPVRKELSGEQNAALAQKFVDFLAESSDFKPCVSFGQDNGLVYATVPATSTQGAISEEDKAKQAVGGIQLVRLSFPPTCNLERVLEQIRSSVKKLYA